MFEFLQKSQPGHGSVFFRGNLPPRAEEFEFLRATGIQISPGKPSPDLHWILELKHPAWGEATMRCFREQLVPPRDLVRLQKGFSGADLAEAEAAGTGVLITTPATRKNVLRDRKNLLRYLEAAMGDDAVVAADHTSSLFWSRAMLRDELIHDADLDVSALFSIHAVTREEGDAARVYWIHTHGLAELGAFDFDIVGPSTEFAESCGDLMRAAAFNILEGAIKPDTPAFPLAWPGGEARFVPVAEFDRKAPALERALRDMSDGHAESRSVVCEPTGRGFLSRLFGGNKIRASRFCAESDLEGVVVHFSVAATELMAQRAVATFPVFAAIREEFAEFEFPAMVKMGYDTDAGAGGGKEHLWFEVHAINRDGIDATLMNEPHQISGMKQGERAVRPVSRLTEWTLATPAGNITPTQHSTARLIRENMDKVRTVMASIAQSRSE